ncbi:hypothetical protein KC19_VG322300 [Ceratodon purpureus]|uniref:Uncharacterized protein n=1 Tax=Ceratodon purpureus TaxID=3225 RepID=A0A8T0HVT6_CERPU|nr:hypothetical protein KC19_VG322300 [Ceratodon purpureus]
MFNSGIVHLGLVTTFFVHVDFTVGLMEVNQSPCPCGNVGDRVSTWMPINPDLPRFGGRVITEFTE